MSDRLLQVWGNVKVVVKFWEKLPKSKRPSSKSYFAVKDAVDDPLIQAKLQCFSYVAGIVEPFLRLYQTDNPMIPYMYFDLKSLVKQLLEMIVDLKVIEDCKSGKQLKDLDLLDETIFLPLNKMSVGFAAEQVIQNLKRSDIVGNFQIKEFYCAAKRFIIEMLSKLFERSPLGSSFILKAASIFDPSILIQLPKEKSQSRWKDLMKCLLSLDILAPQQCDRATAQFKSFLGAELRKFHVEFEELSKEDRLDEFYFDTVGIQKYQDVAYVLKLILTLSHGQASVEQGFSHNNALLKTNMTPETIIAKRIIKDHMLFHKLKPHTVEISDALVKSFKGAHMKYKLHLAEKKEKQVLSEAENKALHISSDIEKIRSNVRVMEKAVLMMNTDIFECMQLAEKKKI